MGIVEVQGAVLEEALEVDLGVAKDQGEVLDLAAVPVVDSEGEEAVALVQDQDLEAVKVEDLVLEDPDRVLVEDLVLIEIAVAEIVEVQEVDPVADLIDNI